MAGRLGRAIFHPGIRVTVIGAQLVRDEVKLAHEHYKTRPSINLDQLRVRSYNTSRLQEFVFRFEKNVPEKRNGIRVV